MSNQQYTNDLSLLRPFNLEAAKNGELLTAVNNCYSFKFLTYCKSDNNIYCQLTDNSQDHVYLYTTNNLRMKPLAWVEGKHVYKGDVLYWKYKNYKFLAVDKIIEDNIIQGYTCDHDGEIIYGKEGDSGVTSGTLTWNKPKQKVKRKIWINVYPDGCFSYFSKDSADMNSPKPRIACVETEIEYEG